LVDLAVPHGDQDFLVFYHEGNWTDMPGLLDDIRTNPLIPGRKVIVVPDTNLFQSKETMPEIIDRIRERLAGNPLRAGEDFMGILSQAGLTLQDLVAGGWKSISQTEGLKIMSPEAWEEREAWLPKVIEICASRQLPPHAGADESQGLINALLQGMPRDTHLILSAGSVDRRKRLYKAISEVGRIVYYPKPKGQTRQLQSLIEAGRGLLTAAGREMAPRAWEVLGNRVGFDLQAAKFALEKVINYATGKKITEQDVEEVVGDDAEATLFDLVGATWERNLGRALVILDDLLYRINHMQVLSFFAREIRLMLQAKDIEKLIGGKYSPAMDYPRFQSAIYPMIKAGESPKGKGSIMLAGQHPYVVYNCLRNAGRFRREELIGLLDYLLEIDVSLKTTGKDPRLMLESFIIRVATGRAGSRGE
ncbi:MAG: DNA polymerase III subunit delta, partial [Smithellaceae bacterium]|nr:DNA polymerase III subunit delta [Smithellaceae bacterium]